MILLTGGGHAWLLWGGVHGCSGGGHAWLLRGGVRGCSGGHVWLLWRGMHGCCQGGHGFSQGGGGACMVFAGVGGHAWFLLGGMHGFCWGACMVFPLGGMCGFSRGGMCVGYDEIRSMSRRYTSYWNAFLLLANVVCEGYIFTGVCDSVNRGGMCGCLGGVRGCSGGDMHGCSGGHAVVALGGSCMVALGGMHGCCRGDVVFPGGHVWFFPGGHVCRIQRDTVNERAVRILLECILVLNIFSWNLHKILKIGPEGTHP